MGCGLFILAVPVECDCHFIPQTFMSESNLMRVIMLAVGKVPTIKLFRNNTGTGWTGKMTWLNNKKLLIEDPRPIHAGLCDGSSDLIGWKIVTVTEDMVGKQVALFAAVEVKANVGRASKEQINFMFQVRNAGGISGVVRDPDEARKLLS